MIHVVWCEPVRLRYRPPFCCCCRIETCGRRSTKRRGCSWTSWPACAYSTTRWGRSTPPSLWSPRQHRQTTGAKLTWAATTLLWLTPEGQPIGGYCCHSTVCLVELASIFMVENVNKLQHFESCVRFRVSSLTALRSSPTGKNSEDGNRIPIGDLSRLFSN